MTNLQDETEKIEQFVLQGLQNFVSDKGAPTVMGIYSCPMDGWISLNFNKAKSLEQTFYNCPDFEFVEYSLLDSQNWTEEYESDNSMWLNQTLTYRYNLGDGDEELNIFIYNFLRNLLLKLNSKSILPNTFIQFLDSKIAEAII